MYRALYRKWRPHDFDEVVGQERITKILQYEVSAGKTSHAYLFCGSRGTGKTTCAKILAKAVNCENPQNGNPCNCCPACLAIDAGTATDVIEMDAASNTGVDNVRDIKDEIVFTPAELKYRVYIIDEVHMMSGSAFNALLKTLEEPPEHVVFILATTEIQKLPSTIVSRCQRFDFRRLPSSVIVARLQKIAETEKIDLCEDGAKIIARMAMGGMRDAISLLELCAGSQCRLDAAKTVEILGVGDRSSTAKLVRAVAEKEYSVIFSLIADEVMSSRDLMVFVRETFEYYRDLLIAKTASRAAEYLDLTDLEQNELLQMAERFSLETLLYHSRLLQDAISAMQRADAPRRAIVELTFTRMCEPKLSDTQESLLARLSDMENRLLSLQNGAAVIPTPAVEPAKKQEPQPKEEKKQDPIKEEPQVKAKEAQKPVAVGSYSEICERVTQSHPAIRGFLDSAKLYRGKKEGQYVLLTNSSFVSGLLSREEVKKAILASICAEEGTLVSACSLTITEKENNSSDVVAEIMAAIGEE